MSAANDQVRNSILEILYNLSIQNPRGSAIEREEMVKLLQVADNIMDFNIFYLEEMGLIRFFVASGAPWYSASITARGIDVFEHKDRFKGQFPFIQATIQNIQGDVNAPVIQSVASQVNFSQQVNEAFKQAQVIIESREGLSHEQKDEIKQQVKLLEEELGREEPDAGRIQKFWKWLKQNASWIVPTIASVVTEGYKIAMDK
jgi:hypothetical protein